MNKPIYKKWWFIALAAIVVLLIISRFLPDSTTTESPQKRIGIGEVLKTDYFDVVVNNVTIDNHISTGNQFADIPEQPGNKFVILDVTFKNTDNESRMLTDGELIINSNGKEYKYEKSETIMLEGWGLIIDNINPLTTKTTKIVYKIPSDIKGVAFYRPGRAGHDEVILLGNL